jgi:myo-inositol-1(or 4)-monophosphatase
MIAISIGLLVNKKSVVGVCVNPILKDTYWAIKGKGAFKNDQPIYVSKITEVKDALFSSNFPSGLQRTEKFNKLMNSRFEKLMDLGVHGIRMGGSAVMNLVQVAEGSLDCFFETGIQAWDMAAGIILVEEAGGLAIDFSGKEYDVLNHNIIVSNSPNIQKEILKVLNE